MQGRGSPEQTTGRIVRFCRPNQVGSTICERVIVCDLKCTGYMDICEKWDFPYVPNHLNLHLLRYESETKNSALTIFQDFSFSPCTHKIYLIKPFLQLEKLII